LPSVVDADPVPQSGEPTYADKLTVEEFDLSPARPAIELDRVVRAGNPRPGAWMLVGGKRIKVWRAHPEPTDGAGAAAGTVTASGALVTADGFLVLDEVQPEGKRTMSGAAWRAGLRADARVDH